MINKKKLKTSKLAVTSFVLSLVPWLGLLLIIATLIAVPSLLIKGGGAEPILNLSIGLVVFVLPICLIGIIFGAVSIKSERKEFAWAGIIVNIFDILFFLIMLSFMLFF